jgi:hypothetical protein
LDCRIKKAEISWALAVPDLKCPYIFPLSSALCNEGYIKNMISLYTVNNEMHFLKKHL